MSDSTPSRQPENASEQSVSKSFRSGTGALLEEYRRMNERLIALTKDIALGSRPQTFETNIQSMVSPGGIGIGNVNKSRSDTASSPDQSESHEPSSGSDRPFADTSNAPETSIPDSFDPWEDVENTYHWFSSDWKEQEERAFILTVALFGGIAQEDIFQAWTEIKNLLGVRNPADDTILFNSPVERLMDIAHCEFTEYEQMSHAGPTLTTAISFRDQRASGMILLMLCRYYRQRELMKLLHLLKDKVENDNHAPLRERAAVALGMLGQIEFSLVRSITLDAWSNASNRNTRIRYAVGTVLNTIYQPGGRFNDNIFTLVKAWASSNNIRLMKTAAICCSRLGKHDLNQVIVILERLIRQDHIDLIEPLVYTTGYIFQGLNEQAILHLLEQFATWAADDSEILQLGSILVFVGWVRLTLNRDFRRYIIQALNSGKDLDFWNLPAEYRGDDANDFRRRYVMAISTILGRGLQMGDLISREIKQALIDYINQAERRQRYRPLVKLVYTDLCCNKDYPPMIRYRHFNWLQQWSQAPRHAEMEFLRELYQYIRKFKR